ncbi:hypothetical protein PIB30_016107 [Stylosanthes scabra]|uniref:Uncharacterized protein n=1 Tax=Stylosanthes scabra TaxID=79078 RepID=A0ABU6Q783_9FABA|nr:hypothetical protein [Stylosanthes scabra]
MSSWPAFRNRISSLLYFLHDETDCTLLSTTGCIPLVHRPLRDLLAVFIGNARVHRVRLCRQWLRLRFRAQCTLCRVPPCAMPDVIAVSFLVVKWHHLLLLLLHLCRVTMNHLPRRTIRQQRWWETPMSLTLPSECFTEPPRLIILKLHMDRSASTDSAPSSHHSSGSSSDSVSLGYGSASSGSASDGASDDDLVNRYFTGTFPPP